MQISVQEKVASFFRQYPLRRYDRQQMLVYAADAPAGVFYIVEGQVRQYDISSQGDEIVVNVFKPGAFFPMAWAINASPNRYFYESSTAVTAHLAPAKDAVAFLKANPDVMFDLLSRVYSGTDGMQRRMAHLMGGTAETRVAFELLVECKRFGEQRPDGGCVISIHEEELARRAGLSRETVNRELSKLKQAGLLAVSHKNLLITNMPQLEAQLGDTV